jgi:putative glutamine amidotransferase
MNESARRPLIGVFGRPRRGSQVSGFPANLADLDLDVYVDAYARAVTEAGGLPVYVPLHAEPADYAGRLDGLLLTGGTDVDPAHYGAEPDPAMLVPEPSRDRLELAVLDLAADEDLAVLGICRGVQVLNVWAGGTLHQDLPAHARFDVAAGERVDELTIVPGTLLHDLYGPHLAVNSLHHQAVARIADGWTVSARSSLGHVEALEWSGHDVVGVQWHPELLDSRAHDPIFDWLVERAAMRSRARQPAAS